MNNCLGQSQGQSQSQSQAFDMNTLKTIICNLREQNMSFQDISDKLRDDYDIIRSRQAVQSLYSRSTKIKNKAPSDYELKIVAETMSIYALGYNMTKVFEYMQSLGYDISYQKIINIIKDSDKHLRSIENAMIQNISYMIDQNTAPINMRQALSYRGIPIKPERFTYLVNQVILGRINNYATNLISAAYRITGDTKATKEMCNLISLVDASDIISNNRRKLGNEEK